VIGAWRLLGEVREPGIECVFRAPTRPCISKHSTQDGAQPSDVIGGMPHQQQPAQSVYIHGAPGAYDKDTMGEWQRLLYEDGCSAVPEPQQVPHAANRLDSPGTDHPVLQAVGSGGSGASSASAATLAEFVWSPGMQPAGCAAADAVAPHLQRAMPHDWQQEPEHMHLHHPQGQQHQQQYAEPHYVEQHYAEQQFAGQQHDGQIGCAAPQHPQDTTGDVFELEGLEWDTHHEGAALPPAAHHTAASGSFVGQVPDPNTSPLDMLASLAFPHATVNASTSVAEQHGHPGSLHGVPPTDAVLAAGARSMAEQLVQLARSRPDLLLGIMSGILDPAQQPQQMVADGGSPGANYQAAEHELDGGLLQPVQHEHADTHLHSTSQYQQQQQQHSMPSMTLVHSASGSLGAPPAVAPSPSIPPYAVIQQLPPRNSRRGMTGAKRRRLASAAASPNSTAPAQQAVPMQVMSALLQLMATAVQAQKDHHQQQQQQQEQEQQPGADPGGMCYADYTGFQGM